MIDGFTSPKFEALKAVFAKNFDDGDLGASVAVIHRGDVVVDLWGGHLDSGRTREWQRDSITNVWSTTKTMTALAMLLLIDRGELDPDAPVARYWPEFASHGKDNVLVRHIMSHTAGLPGWPTPVDGDVLYDWDLACATLADQPTWWEPGSRSGYHAVSQGNLCGEVVRRITGASLGAFFAKEIAGPAGADFHIGTSQAHDHRVVAVIPPAGDLGAAIPDDPAFAIAKRTFASVAIGAERSATVAWRRAEIPAAGGHGNARSVAMAQHAVSHGGAAFGRRLLSPETIDVIFREQIDNTDAVLQIPFRHGIGYGLPGASMPLPVQRAAWWAGWGGSLCVNDVENGFTFAYVMNKMLDGTIGDLRAAGLLMAVYGALM